MLAPGSFNETKFGAPRSTVQECGFKLDAKISLQRTRVGKHWNVLPKEAEDDVFPSGCLFFLRTFSPASGLADRWS